MKKGFKLFCILVFFGICAIPLLLMGFVKNDTMQMEKREPKPMPAYMIDGRLNLNFSDGFEAWLNDRIPFRAQLLSSANFLKGEVLHAASSNVIVGRDGWLFYNTEADDYLNANALTDGQIQAMAVTISLIEENVTRRGGAFTFVPMPNKASVYGDRLPAAYRAAEENNLSRLTEALKEYGVNFVNMKQVMLDARAQGKEVYHRRDSHWNYLGALIGYNAIMDSLSREHSDWSDVQYTVETTWRGDLDKLLRSDDMFSDNTLEKVEARSPELYKVLNAWEIETVCVIRIGMDMDTDGYLICAEPRNKRIWQEAECAMLYFLAKMIAARIRIDGEVLE